MICASQQKSLVNVRRHVSATKTRKLIIKNEISYGKKIRETSPSFVGLRLGSFTIAQFRSSLQYEPFSSKFVLFRIKNSETSPYVDINFIIFPGVFVHARAFPPDFHNWRKISLNNNNNLKRGKKTLIESKMMSARTSPTILKSCLLDASISF